MTESDKRRCKILHIQADSIITLLGAWAHCDFMQLPVLSGIPKGYEVMRVQYDFGRDAIAVLIRHPSFEATEPGCIFPIIDGGPIKLVNMREMTVDEKAKAAAIPIEERRKKSWEFLGAPL